MKTYSTDIQIAKQWISQSPNILIGAGAGLSASGGLDYLNPDFVAQIFLEFAEKGFTNLMQILSTVWNVSDRNALHFYAVWARHIHAIRYKAAVTEPYLLLKKLTADKDYFINTTNVDSQFEKAGFDTAKIFAMQGNYALFQCVTPCSDAVYDNQEWLEKTLQNMPNPLQIREEDIPKCPNCGNYLIPNLRKDSLFVEAPHIKNIADYEGFINEKLSSQLVLLELGVGFNTPTIIRFPFEQIAKLYPEKVKLIRINQTDAQVPNLPNCIGIEGDITEVLRELTIEN